MDAISIIQKLSKLYIKGLVHQDQMHQFTMICMDVLRELEIAKLSKDEVIVIPVDGRIHKQLIALLEAADATPNE